VLKWVIIITLLILGFTIMNLSVTADSNNPSMNFQDQKGHYLRMQLTGSSSSSTDQEFVILGETISDEWPKY
jgi:hypothetical protein